MTTPLSRVSELFVAPRDERSGAHPHAADVRPERTTRRSRLADAFLSEPEPREREAARAADAVAVLARRADAAAAGGAVALALARGTALVALWGAGAPAVRAPARPGARRAAARLAGRGHDACASGRLVIVALGDGLDEGVRAAAAAGVPAVLVVAGPRDERVDAVLRGQDRAIAVGEGGIAELAARSVASSGVPARTLALPPAPAARALAAAGVALVAPLRAPVADALR
jgi:hypothetical protein